MKKTYIKVKCGILDPKHRRKLGLAVYLYMYILDNANWDDGIVHEWTDKNAAQELEFTVNTVRDYRKILEDNDYITTKKGQHSQSIIIYNWSNPRSYDGAIINPRQNDSDAQSDAQSDTQTSTNQSVDDVSTYNQMSDVKGHIIYPAKAPENKPEPVYSEFNNQADMPQEWAEEYLPKKQTKKPKNQPDPRYLHIAYSTFYSITKRRPNKELVDLVIDILGDNPDVERARACYVEWLSRGYNPMSLKWLDWYVTGIPGYQKKDVQSSNDAILKQAMEGLHGS